MLNIIEHDRNPLGGRPAGIGSLQVGIFYGGAEQMIMYHLGYCPSCGAYLRCTREQAQKILKGLSKEVPVSTDKRERLWMKLLWKMIPIEWQDAVKQYVP